MEAFPWEETCTNFEKLRGFHYDCNASGEGFPKSARCVLKSTTPLEAHHLAAPWGYGASLFLLGSNESLLTQLINDPSTFDAATQVAVELPKFAGRLARGCRMQVGVRHLEDTPVREAREIPLLVLAVWGHDEGFSLDIKERVASGEAPCTVGEFANSGELRGACDAGTRLRQQLARAVLDALDFPLPRGLITEDPTIAAFQVDCPTFTMLHQPAIGGKRGEHVTCCLDASELHAGSKGAAVYYSAAAGSCFYQSPKSRGRLGHARGGLAGLVSGSTGFRDGAGPLEAMGKPPPVGGADITVLPAVNEGTHRWYLSIDADESDRLVSCGDNSALEITQGDRIRVRAITTAIVGPFSSSNPKLYGRIAIESVSAVLACTSPLQHTVVFQNTPEWVTRLTAFAPGGRVWNLLNEGSAKNDANGDVTYYEIERSSLTE